MGKKIIGGEFSINPCTLLSRTHKNWRVDTSKIYSSGRAAFYAVLKGIGKIADGGVMLPDYLCISLSQTAADAGVAYTFYHVGSDLMPDLSSLGGALKKSSSVLLINYFGLIDLTETVNFIRKSAPSIFIILDDVQNFYGFDREPDFDFSFTSLRKWFPVPDGALVKARAKVELDYVELDKKNKFAQYKLAGNLLKNYREFIDEEIFLALIGEGEEIFESGYRCRCSEITECLLETLDYQCVAKRRKLNAAELHRGLTDMGIKHFYNADIVPLFVPVILSPEERDDVRKRLFEKNIFCPVHWPWVSETKNGRNSFYDTELSLICDQRYTEKDMESILEVLQNGCCNYR